MQDIVFDFGRIRFLHDYDAEYKQNDFNSLMNIIFQIITGIKLKTLQSLREIQILNQDDV